MCVCVDLLKSKISPLHHYEGKKPYLGFKYWPGAGCGSAPDLGLIVWQGRGLAVKEVWERPCGAGVGGGGKSSREQMGTWWVAGTGGGKQVMGGHRGARGRWDHVWRSSSLPSTTVFSATAMGQKNLR